MLDEAHSKDVNEANSGSAAPFADVVVRMFTGSGNPVRSGELTAFYILFT